MQSLAKRRQPNRPPLPSLPAFQPRLGLLRSPCNRKSSYGFSRFRRRGRISRANLPRFPPVRVLLNVCFSRSWPIIWSTWIVWLGPDVG